MIVILCFNLLAGFFGCCIGHFIAYRAFCKSFKIGVRDHMIGKSHDELCVFEEVLNELREEYDKGIENTDVCQNNN